MYQTVRYSPGALTAGQHQQQAARSPATACGRGRGHGSSPASTSPHPAGVPADPARTQASSHHADTKPWRCRSSYRAGGHDYAAGSSDTHQGISSPGSSSSSASANSSSASSSSDQEGTQYWPSSTPDTSGSRLDGAAAGHAQRSHEHTHRHSPNADILTHDELQQVARRYLVVGVLKGVIGAALLLAPTQLAVAALQHTPSPLEIGFARLTGAVVLFRCLLAALLRDAALSGRLHSTTCQRLMLGCLLPTINHYLAFKKMVASAVLAASPLLYLYPLLLGVEFVAHITTFEAFNPYFLAKLTWPVVFGMLVSTLMPPLPDVPLQLPKALSPVSAGGAVLLGSHGVRLLPRLGRLLPTLGRLLPRLGRVYIRSKASGRMFKRLLPEAGPTLLGTAAKLMDFHLPVAPLAWGYWFMMLSFFGLMFNAYRPETLFVGQVTPVSCLLKQSWSAGFLAAAFAANALKTAADRDRLAMQENRNLNLCLAALELVTMSCLAACLASGAAVASPYCLLRLATSAVSAAFCLHVWHDSTLEAGRKGWPVELSLVSQDFQAAEERRKDYRAATAAAVVVLTFLNGCL